MRRTALAITGWLGFSIWTGLSVCFLLTGFDRRHYSSKENLETDRTQNNMNREPNNPNSLCQVNKLGEFLFSLERFLGGDPQLCCVIEAGSRWSIRWDWESISQRNRFFYFGWSEIKNRLRGFRENRFGSVKTVIVCRGGGGSTISGFSLSD